MLIENICPKNEKRQKLRSSDNERHGLLYSPAESFIRTKVLVLSSFIRFCTIFRETLSGDGLMIGFVSEVIGFGVYDVYHVVPGKGSVWE